MAIVIQDFIKWENNKEKRIGSYVKPTTSSLFTYIGTNLIVNNINLWNNLITGDKVNFISEGSLPNPLNSSEKYVRKIISPKLTIHNSLNDSLSGINPITFSGGTGLSYINFNFGKIFKSTNNGLTGTQEPIWNRTKNEITIDNDVRWKTINPLVSEYNPLEFLPEQRQKEDLFIKYSEILAHILAITNEEARSIFDKYKDYLNLDDIYLYELLSEYGYNYLADASILNTNQLTTLYAYLKIIHILKGTRTGLKLVLELLGYPNTDTLWYEKTPRGEPHTFDINMQFLYQTYTAKTITNLINFLRLYVYPLAKVETEILPFELGKAWTGGKGVADQAFDYNFNFFVPLVPSPLLMQFNYNEEYGYILEDQSPLDNDGFIIITGNETDLKFKYTFTEGTGTSFEDLSTNNNDGTVIVSIIENFLLMSFPYAESSGNLLNDISTRNNNGIIITSFLDNLLLFEYLYSEETGTLFNDTSTRNNVSNILVSLSPTNNLINYDYSENTGTSLNDTSVNSFNASIISNTTNFPRVENLQIYLPLSGDGLDTSGKNNHAIVNGGTFSFGKFVTGHNITDYLSLPFGVLDGVGDFTIGGRLRINEFHAGNLNTLISGARNSQPDAFVIAYASSEWRLIFNGISYSFYTDLTLLGLTEESFIFVRRGQFVELWINGVLTLVDSFTNSIIDIDSGGLILLQEQDSLSGNFDANQSWDGSLDNFFIYNIALSESDILKLYNLPY